MFEKLTKTLDSYLEKGIPGYDCTVYYKGSRVYRHFNGYSDLENKIPVNGKELYNIYSCSKPITCVTALMLYEDGLFGLDDKLSDYIPEYKEMTVKTENGIKKAEKEITIKNLFCMTAGFSYGIDTPQIRKCKEETGGRCPTLTLVKYLAKESLLFEPGEEWNYSLCHDVLGAVLEVITGKSLGELAKERIFDPLGMKNTTYRHDKALLDRVCAHYRYNPETKSPELRDKEIAYRLGTEYESGGAGCISTVDDYIIFLEAMRTKKLLKEETIKLMTTNYLSEKQLKSYWITGGYGYGLGVRCPMEGSGLTDYGWGGAAGSYLAIDEQNEFTLFYAQHVLGSPVQTIRNELGGLVAEIIKSGLR